FVFLLIRILFLLLFFLFFHRLLDGLDEVGGLFVGSHFGGQVVGVFALGIIESSHALVGVVENSPNDFHAGDFRRPSSKLCLGRRGRYDGGSAFVGCLLGSL